MKGGTPVTVKYKPDAYHTVTPYLIVFDVPRLIEFLRAAFGGVEIERVTRPDGTVGHAEVRIGDSIVMMGQADSTHKSVESCLYVYVPDTDLTYKAALAAGATSTMEPVNMFWGDRNAGVKDMFGNSWWIATKVEQVPPEELQRRAAEWREKQKAG
jgi:uncharacterized glyoxalase superfamily protein PhnB